MDHLNKMSSLRQIIFIASFFLAASVLPAAADHGATISGRRVILDTDFSWRNYATEDDLKGLGIWLDDFTMASSWLALSERACHEAVPPEDTEAEFLTPLFDRGVLMPIEVESSVPRKKYEAWQTLSAASFTRCDPKKISIEKDARQRDLVKLDMIKQRAIGRQNHRALEHLR